MAGRNSDSSSSSSSTASSGERLVCEISPKGVASWGWQSSTDANGEYFSKWDRSAYAALQTTKDPYFCTGPAKPTKQTVSVRWYVKPAGDSAGVDSGMTGSSVKE